MTMDETVQRAIDRNYTRILRDERGSAYAGHEDWLREGLVLMTEDELGKDASAVDTAAFLDRRNSCPALRRWGPWSGCIGAK